MVIQKDGDYNITRRNFIAKPEGKTKTLCKCFCRQPINHSRPILNHSFTNSLMCYNLWGLGTEKELGCRTGPLGYISWRSRFLVIDSCARIHRPSFGEKSRKRSFCVTKTSVLGIEEGRAASKSPH
jgi:hypothetical protein